MEGKEGLFIGELGCRVALPTQTIRYYERIGLLNPPKRTEAQYRVYSAEDEERLLFIQKAKRFGLSLNEIKKLIEIRTEGIPPCASLKAMVKQHLGNLDHQIQEMISLRQELANRYKQIDTLLPDSTAVQAEETCDGKICRFIEQEDEEV